MVYESEVLQRLRWEVQFLPIYMRRTEILPEYSRLFLELAGSYETVPHSREYAREQCRGTQNFVQTLNLVMNRTEDAETVRSAYKTLKAIVTRPNAGSFSWEMRRWIRYASPDLVKDFCELVRQNAELDTTFMLDMDSYWWDINWGDYDAKQQSLETLEGLKDSLDRRKKKFFPQ